MAQLAIGSAPEQIWCLVGLGEFLKSAADEIKGHMVWYKWYLIFVNILCICTYAVSSPGDSRYTFNNAERSSQQRKIRASFLSLRPCVVHPLQTAFPLQQQANANPTMHSSDIYS